MQGRDFVHMNDHRSTPLAHQYTGNIQAFGPRYSNSPLHEANYSAFNATVQSSTNSQEHIYYQPTTRYMYGSITGPVENYNPQSLTPPIPRSY